VYRTGTAIPRRVVVVDQDQTSEGDVRIEGLQALAGRPVEVGVETLSAVTQ
jgi:hypothetical protein